MTKKTQEKVKKIVEKETEKNYKDYLVNPGSERSIISICLKNPEKILECDEQRIEAEQFVIPAHRFIYNAILYLYSKQQTPSPISIIEVITSDEGKKEIGAIGGLEYLSSLSEAYINEDNLKIVCDKVKQSYTRRLIYEACITTQTSMLNSHAETLNQSELVGILEHKVSDIAIKVSNAEEAYKMGDDTDRVLTLRAEQPSVIPGLETGWTQLDSYTGGMQGGDLVFVCARSKTGKSVLLTNWATEFGIQQRLPVLYIDTEMNSRQQEDRMLAKLSGIPVNEIVSGLYTLDTVNGKGRDKIEKLNQVKFLLREGLYYHMFMPNYSLDRVTALTKKFKLQKNICALYFDYLKLTSGQASSMKASQEYQMLGFLATGLKDLAGMLDIPVISAVQENRNAPKSTDKDETNVGGSDRILQNATKLLFLYNKSEEQIAKQGINSGNQQLKVAFQRNGSCDCPPIDVMFDRPRLDMREN